MRTAETLAGMNLTRWAVTLAVVMITMFALPTGAWAQQQAPVVQDGTGVAPVDQGSNSDVNLVEGDKTDIVNVDPDANVVVDQDGTSVTPGDQGDTGVTTVDQGSQSGGGGSGEGGDGDAQAGGGEDAGQGGENAVAQEGGDAGQGGEDAGQVGGGEDAGQVGGGEDAGQGGVGDAAGQGGEDVQSEIPEPETVGLSLGAGWDANGATVTAIYQMEDETTIVYTGEAFGLEAAIVPVGATVTLSITPGEGYYVDEVTVTKDEGEEQQEQPQEQSQEQSQNQQEQPQEYQSQDQQSQEQSQGEASVVGGGSRTRGGSDDAVVVSHTAGTDVWSFTMPAYDAEATVIYKQKTTVTVTLPVGLSTYYHDKGLRVSDSNADGVKMYAVTAVSDDQVTLKEISNRTIPAYTPVIISNSGTGALACTFEEAATDARESEFGQMFATDLGTATPAKEFIGTAEALSAYVPDNSATVYGFNGAAFVKMEGTLNIAANRCWIEIGGMTAGGARELNIVLDGETTGIHSVDNG